MGGKREDHHKKIVNADHNWNLHQFVLQLQKVRSRQITYVILVTHNMCFPGTHIVCIAVPPSNCDRNLQKGQPCRRVGSPSRRPAQPARRPTAPAQPAHGADGRLGGSLSRQAPAQPAHRADGRLGWLSGSGTEPTRPAQPATQPTGAGPAGSLSRWRARPAQPAHPADGWLNWLPRLTEPAGTSSAGSPSRRPHRRNG